MSARCYVEGCTTPASLRPSLAVMVKGRGEVMRIYGARGVCQAHASEAHVRDYASEPLKRQIMGVLNHMGIDPKRASLKWHFEPREPQKERTA